LGKVTLAFSQCQQILYILCLKMFKQKSFCGHWAATNMTQVAKWVDLEQLAREPVARDADQFIPAEDIVKTNSL